MCDPHEFESVLDKVFLDVIVEGCASLERRCMIDFDDDGVKIICQHDIEPQNMKAHISFVLFRLAVLILMPDSRQPADDGLYDCVFNLRFQGLDIYSVFGEPFVGGRERPLVALVHVLFGAVVDIFGVVFVERIVCQVDVAAVDVVVGGLVILLSCKSREAFVINVEPEGVGACHQHVDAQIELEFIDQKWIFDILLDHILITVQNILDVPSQKDSSPLGKSFGFHDIRPGLALLNAFIVLPELAEL